MKYIEVTYPGRDSKDFRPSHEGLTYYEIIYENDARYTDMLLNILKYNKNYKPRQ